MSENPLDRIKYRQFQNTLENRGGSETIIRSMSNILKKMAENNVSTVFFLDRSARPLAYLAKEMWQVMYQGREFPAVRFINIGKETSQKDINQSGGVGDIYSIPDDGTIMIIDEFVMHGHSLRRAKELLDKSFPNREFITISPYLHEFRELPAIFKGIEDRSVEGPMKFVAQPHSDQSSVEARIKLRKYLKEFVKNNAEKIKETTE